MNLELGELAFELSCVAMLLKIHLDWVGERGLDFLGATASLLVEQG